ncbi:MAG: DMT family transporter, partial [Rhodospirillales bacterium]|nr:DMT family transporter [Rhodospirillales bacterium]
MTDSPTISKPQSGSQESPKNYWIAAMPATFVFLWSTGFIGAKYGMPYTEPFTFLSVRFLLVIGLMLLLSFITKAPWPTSIKMAIHIAIAGALVNAMYLGGVFASLHHGLPVGITALITGLQPILTAMFARHLLGETVNRRQWLGIGVGFIGVALVVAHKVGGPDSNLTGLWLAVVALIGITAGTLYQKKFCCEMDLRSGSVIQFSSSLIFILILAVCFESMAIQWTGEFIFALFWLVIILSIGAISLLMVLIRRGAAAKVASLFYLVPPVTALMSFFIFDEALGLT